MVTVPGPRSFTTRSGRPVEQLYTAEQVAPVAADQSLPGEYPYTRGLHAGDQRGKLWTMRQFAGVGTPEQTNREYRQLLAAGGTGLSVAFDVPTLMGRDPDDGLSRGHVGRRGVSIATLADMEALFAGIDLAGVSTALAIDAPAPVMLAMYLVTAERQGVPLERLSGTIQNDMLQELIARKPGIYPPRASLRAVTDVIAFCTEQVPAWNTVSVSGCHVREAGATAGQELAFTLRKGIEYVEAAVAAGLDVDRFARRISFVFASHSDFFEEIAKFRAARRVWAKVMRERFHARDPRSWQLRFHAQTAGASLTAQQPYNNVVRTALQALAAAMGGTQSLHTNPLARASMESTEQASLLALRTQQVIAYESGVADFVDPFGGSYFVEHLTTQLEAEAMEEFERIDRMGGMVEAIEHGYAQRKIAESASRFQQEVDRGDRVVVGVTEFQTDEEEPSLDLRVDEGVERQQLARLAEVKQGRDASAVASALSVLRRAAEGGRNVMPAMLNAVRAWATLGEVCGELRSCWGEYPREGDTLRAGSPEE